MTTSFKLVARELQDKYNIRKSSDLIDWNSNGIRMQLSGLSEDQAEEILDILKGNDVLEQLR